LDDIGDEAGTQGDNLSLANWYDGRETIGSAKRAATKNANSRWFSWKFWSFPKVDRIRSDRESWKVTQPLVSDFGLRQWGCHRNEPRFATGRDTGVSGVPPFSELCVRWLLK